MHRLYAGLSVSTAGLSWLPMLETGLRVVGSLVALAAGLLSIYLKIKEVRATNRRNRS